MHDVQYDRDDPRKLSPAVPSVEAREDRIAQALDRLEGQIEKLSARLAPVLADPESPGPALTPEPPPGRSMHGQRLDHLGAYAERLGEVVNALAARVDL